jgi:hypothetical protein
VGGGGKEDGAGGAEGFGLKKGRKEGSERGVEFWKLLWKTNKKQRYIQYVINCQSEN